MKLNYLRTWCTYLNRFTLFSKVKRACQDRCIATMLYAHPFFWNVVDNVLTYFSFIAVVTETYKIVVLVRWQQKQTIKYSWTFASHLREIQLLCCESHANFVSPDLKLHYWYCHNIQLPAISFCHSFHEVVYFKLVHHLLRFLLRCPHKQTIKCSLIFPPHLKKF